MINVAVLGYGTVGSGVVEIIDSNSAQITKKVGQEVNVKYILDLREFHGDPNEGKVVHDINIILDDPEVDIVCETMGGTGAAYTFTKSALERGKSVCTSNKAMVAAHGTEMMRLAEKMNCNYQFEASVGGGIPVIRPMMTSLAHEYIESIAGILNGTTNYILTKMEREGAKYEDVLAQAQALGYAERDPSADVDGFDAGRKISILSSIMMGSNVDYEKVYTEGITKITADDFAYAAAADCTIKILGFAERQADDSLLAMVSTFFIPKSHPIALVNDVMNGIFVTGNMVGETMYYGSGAGKLPTASAVVADVVDCAKNIGVNIPVFWDDAEVKMADVSTTSRSFFVRVTKDGAQKLTAAYVDAKKIEVPGREDAGFFTPVMTEAEFEALADKLGEDLLGRVRVYA